MNHSVFISYARSSAAADALALKRALGDEAFLDTSEIETRADFTQRIAHALLASKLVVLFADRTYFERPLCRWELDIILAPFYRGGSALDYVFVTKPTGGDYFLDALPPDLRKKNWDARDLPSALVVAARQARQQLSELLTASECRYLLASSLDTVQLPPVKTQQLASIPHSGIGMLYQSLQDRFVGRADSLARLHHELYLRHLGKPSSVALTAALKATGGFGKTRLALEYVHRYAPQYFTGGIFWIQCELPFDEQLWEILRALNPDTPSIDILRRQGADLSSLVKSKIELAVGCHRPVLFVLDNVPETTGSPQPLSNFCPAINIASVLVTSRQDQSVTRTIPLPELSPLSAWLLLTYDIPNRHELSDSEWDEISEWVGRLPLALEILNRALYYHAIPPSILLQRARRRDTTDELDQLAAALPELPRGVTETFEISYRALTADARKAARYVAELAPEPIPEAILSLYGYELISQSARIELHRHSFVTAPPLFIGVAYFGVMHRVVASFLRAKSRIAGSAEEAQRLATSNPNVAACVKFMAALGEAAPSLEFVGGILVINVFFKGLATEEGESRVDDPTTWPLRRAVFPHATYLMRQSAFATARLGSLIAMGAYVQGDLAHAASLLSDVVELRTRLWGLNGKDTLEAMNGLGLVLGAQGKLDEARVLLQRVVDIYASSGISVGDSGPFFVVS